MIETIALITTVSCAGILSLNTKYSKWAFVLGAVGAGLWTYIGIQVELPELMAQSAVFLGINLFAIWRWFK